VSELSLFFEEIERLNLNGQYLQKLIGSLIQKEEKIFGDISVIFCSDEYLLKINEQYLGHNYYTDIVTFDYVEKSVISGDLFISVDRVAENAEKYGNSFIEELHRVLIHGVLHLVGYKDNTTEEQSLMRDKEDFYLKSTDMNLEEV
jgi:probable rRNA maturation factor